MKKITHKPLIISGLAIIIVACSTKKDSFVNRKFHSVNTEYNVLFNGQEAFDKGEKDLFSGFQDDFWNVLPIERVQNMENTMMPGQTKNENFVRAETKATKAIQKHSMYIGGEEKNSQIDEAYLLLGKARYYDGRFLPAIEAFNYVLYKYPKSSTISEVKVWKEKANIRLESNETAIDNLKELFTTEDKNFKKEVVADAHSVMAQAYYNLNVIDSTIIHLTKAKNQTKIHEKQARYNFILGQLHNKINQKDSAFYYFQEVIDMNRKSPRMYVMQAHAQQARLFDYKKGDSLAFMEKYRNLLKDRENRPFLDVLNHEVGVLYDTYNQHDKAIKYYNASLKNKKSDRYLEASNYRNLAQLKFDERKFVSSGKYYDSTLVLLNNKSKEFYHLQRKRKNLDDVIKYEGLIAKADSIYYVTALSQKDKEKYYQTYIDKIKADDIAAAKKAIEIEKKAAIANANSQNQMNPSGSLTKGAPKNLAQTEVINPTSGISKSGRPNGIAVQEPTNTNTNNSGTSNVNSVFYFYVPASVQQGKLLFEKTWGKRELKDNWRWSSDSNISSETDLNAEETIAESKAKIKSDEDLIDLTNPKYSTEFYISQLPTDEVEIENLGKDRRAALYELGFIYDEKFSEYQLAADRLERLLTLNPEQRLILPAKYNLYKLYQKLNSDKALALKANIIKEFPNTHYAKLLSGEVLDLSDSPEMAFKKLYQEYQAGNYVETLTKVNDMIDVYAGSDVIEKFELLKARILARTEGVLAYKEALQNIFKLYPLTNEGIEAKRILEKDIPTLENMKLNDTETTSWKLYYDLSKETIASQKDLETKINKYIAESHNNNLKVSVDMYTKDKSLLVIHGFLSKETALAVNSLLQDVKGYKIKQKGTPISTHNYIVIQTHKNIDQYVASN